MSNNAEFHITTPPPHVVGTGLIALDVIIKKGSEPSGRWAGGTCGNVMSILSYLGWASYPVARLNGDDASKQVLADFERWGVRLQFAETGPGAETPIVIHKIRTDASGQAVHRFSLNCPYCGSFLPTYRAVLASAAENITSKIKNPKVFFFDRVSRGALILAKECADKGALIVFEPSGIGEPKLFKQAAAIAHIVKYSSDRVDGFKDLLSETRPLIEIETRGSEGLRFCGSKISNRPKMWQKLEALSVTEIKDTAGAGDWCTAGLIHLTGQDGFAGFETMDINDISQALRFGQAMAAWTCGFEGARGGVYHRSKKNFQTEVVSILKSAKRSASAVANQSGSLGERQQSRYQSKPHSVRSSKSHRAACCF
jgi:sugar/nucleoside kinase (ribokinase family)